ncbi:MAG: hypothetical protein NTW87_13380 [Planctomycetota bacterium]|nr:hypothetical protein [Planctomycetota bacterium]
MKEENGPLIALIVFAVLSIFFGVMAYLRYQDLMSPEDPSKSPDAKIKLLQKDIQDQEDNIVTLTRQATSLREEVRRQQALYNFYSEMFAEYGAEYTRRMELVKWAENFEKQAGELSGMVTDLKSKTLANVNKETNEAREQMEKGLQEKTASKEQAITRTRQAKEEFDADVKKFRSQRNYEQSGLDEVKSVLTDLTQREVERANIFNQADGHVILSDTVNKVVVLDIGTATGVRNGYRFECFALRPGNKRVHKAYLEVKRADVSMSECLIVQRPVLLPKDPLSPYVAKEPEEMFSPFQESGKKGFSAQPLSAPPKQVMMGMSKEDPIVEGDLVQNPFFAPNKSYTFFIAGSKEIVNEQQKSAIRYRWTEIKAVAEFYGGKVLNAVDTTVNYVIAQKNPKTEGTDAEKAEFQRAIDLGIPVIYEWELFRFLDTR